MKYKNTIRGIFLDRPNRFVAHVDIEGRTETVHVKNTGRCRELLLPGVQVVLEDCGHEMRKTRYDLIAVYKEGRGWINIDSQAPNKVVYEWLNSENAVFRGITLIKPEYRYGASRVDFYLESPGKRILMEVKGCTLERDGKGYFPDAPTERGVKHLHELAGAAAKGYECFIAFVIAMNGINAVYPNTEIHPEFAAALETAVQAGVRVLSLVCWVTADEISIKEAGEMRNGHFVIAGTE